MREVINESNMIPKIDLPSVREIVILNFLVLLKHCQPNIQ